MFELLGLAGGLIGTIGSAAARGSANAEIERQIKNKKALSDERLGLAKTIFNGRMPGATALENNIFGNQATTLSTIQKGATDAGQVISGAASTQGQTNKAFNDLSIEEMMDYQRRYGNLDNAYGNADQTLDDIIAMKGAKAQNKGQTWQELSNFGMGVSNFGVAGGFDNMNFGGGRSRGLTERMPTSTIPHTWGR